MRRSLLVVFLLALSPVAQASSDALPNILFVYLDDFGWRDAGYAKLPGFDGHLGPNGAYSADVLTDRTIRDAELGAIREATGGT